MKVLIFIILVLAAITAYLRYFHASVEQAGAPVAVSSSAAPAQPTQPSTSQMVIERATGKYAVDQGMRARRVIDKANASKARMPQF